MPGVYTQCVCSCVCVVVVVRILRLTVAVLLLLHFLYISSLDDMCVCVRVCAGLEEKKSLILLHTEYTSNVCC